MKHLASGWVGSHNNDETKIIRDVCMRMKYLKVQQKLFPQNEIPVRVHNKNSKDATEWSRSHNSRAGWEMASKTYITSSNGHKMRPVLWRTFIAAGCVRMDAGCHTLLAKRCLRVKDQITYAKSHHMPLSFMSDMCYADEKYTYLSKFNLS